MSRRDFHHDAVVRALEREGWTITDDPLKLSYGARNLYVDLGAENVLAAEKANHTIAVEIKSFIGASSMNDLEKALGQYTLYRGLLKKLQPQRQIYLAVPSFAYEDVLTDSFGQLVMDEYQLHLIVFDENKEEILKWLP